MRVLTLAVGACALIASASAQPLHSDRPSVVAAASVVAPGRVQVEVGASLAHDRTAFASPNGDTLSFREWRAGLPEVLVRVGVARGVEARAELPSYRVFQLRRSDAPQFVLETSSWSAPIVGVKAGLGRAGGVRVAALVSVPLPVGEAGPGQRAMPMLGFVSEAALGSGLALGAGLEVGLGTGSDSEMQPGILRGAIELRARLVRGVRVAAGARADAPWRGGDVGGHLRAGVSVRVARGVTVDAYAGAGLGRATPEAFVKPADVAGGAGLSVRL